MNNSYSVSEIIKNGCSLILTKVFNRDMRLLRRPVYIRGAKSLEGAKNLTTGYGCRFDLEGHNKTLYIGDNCQLGDNTHIVAQNKVVIGNDVLIASKVFISDTSHGKYRGEDQTDPNIAPQKRPLVFSEPVVIGDNVWIGENCVIMNSVGTGSIIGANSVVTHEIPDYVIAAGIPARVIKMWDPDKKIWDSVSEIG